MAEKQSPPKPLKIGLVLDDTLDKPDGVQQYVQVLGRWLSAQGHEVHYLVGQSSRTDYPNVHSLSRNIAVAFNGNRLTTPLPASRKKIKRLLHTLELDVLHVQTPHSPFLAQRVLRAASPRTAIVATFHIMPDSWVVTAATMLLGVLLRPSFASRVQRVFAVSKVAKTFADLSFFINCDVLPNPIELSRFKDAQPYSQYADMPNIVYLNRLVARKGAIYLLEAVEYMVRNALYDKPFRVLICGKGEERPRLEKYVRENQLESIVSFLGYVSEEDKPRYLASAAMTVYPSTGGESFGIVLLEGMASGNGPVIAGNNLGYASVMEPFPDQLIDPRDTPSFAGLLSRFLHDANARQHAKYAQQDYVAQFDIHVVGTKLVEAYTQALQARRNLG